MKYKAGWLTINRACNIRCKWCYAQGTGFNKKDNVNQTSQRSYVYTDWELPIFNEDFFKQIDVIS